MVFNKKYRELTINVSSLLFIVLFVYAAISKLLDFETFTVQLAQSPLLSAYTGVIAWVVPGLEILIAVLLTIPKYRIPALYASFTLMVMFTAYIYIILNFSDFIPCSCGGVLEKLSWTQHLIFNIVFIILAGAAVFFNAQWNAKKNVLMFSSLAIFGIGTVTLLFAFSEKKMHRNNAFIRRYLPHFANQINNYDFIYTSY
uniref:MauE/DoxX family redox-associated membrane protein n=1 Tax=Xanthomarina gelatinilytica TaxID=1137281 RepID=UPI003AA9B8AD